MEAAPRAGEVPIVEEAAERGPVSEAERREVLTLLASIFLIAACGLVYELLIATVSSYLLGSSATQFSLSIGVFIGSMGIGSHLSQRVRRNLLGTFILIEVLLAVIGGVSVCLLFWAYSEGPLYWLLLYGMLGLIGALTGMELPLLTRLLKQYGTLRTIIAQALSFDYLGALAGSLLLPLLLLPVLGMTRTAFLVGLLNVGVAVWNVQVFREQLRFPIRVTGLAGGCAAALGAGFLFSTQIAELLETRLYDDEVVYGAQTRYQKIVLTRWKDDLRLFLDGNLQFAAVDEYRYHEALVHPAMSLAQRPESVLLMGGGDGLAVREVLKYAGVKQVTLVDIDPAMTRLGRTYPAIVELNRGALSDPRVRIVHEDAYRFLEKDARLFDVIIGDLPDPNNDALAKLYSVQFYKLVRRHLAAGGVCVTQATSPFFARDSFWCVARTMNEAGLNPVPYHAYVPSFGDWGFILGAARKPDPARAEVRVPVRFLDRETLRQMFVFSRDSAEVPVDVSTLDRPAILGYYQKNSRRWE